MLVLASALLWLAALFGCDPPTLDAVPSRCVNSTGVTWLPAWEVELLESLQAPDADRAIYGASNPDLVPTEVDYLWGQHDSVSDPRRAAYTHCTELLAPATADAGTGCCLCPSLKACATLGGSTTPLDTPGVEPYRPGADIGALHWRPVPESEFVWLHPRWNYTLPPRCRCAQGVQGRGLPASSAHRQGGAEAAAFPLRSHRCGCGGQRGAGALRQSPPSQAF
jgi:hypothetical protein